MNPQVVSDRGVFIGIANPVQVALFWPKLTRCKTHACGSGIDCKHLLGQSHVRLSGKDM